MKREEEIGRVSYWRREGVDEAGGNGGGSRGQREKQKKRVGGGRWAKLRVGENSWQRRVESNRKNEMGEWS